MKNKASLCCGVFLAHWTIAVGVGGASVNTTAASALSLLVAPLQAAWLLGGNKPSFNFLFYAFIHAFRLNARDVDKWLNLFTKLCNAIHVLKRGVCNSNSSLYFKRINGTSCNRDKGIRICSAHMKV
ncbi:Hypothetical predicted protein [Xyrichtys novacula]|uniref:Secreted protein n=1 Tax=Xyrichtys novacula TaxID=13765 RepID=A0AAV1FHV1_XYRNO|nr:Hypothetical predicted protein [Xyrichtys novacula]